MLIFKHRPQGFDDPTKAACGVTVKSKKYLVQAADRVNCPMCRLYDGIDTFDEALAAIDKDIADLTAMRDKINQHSRGPFSKSTQ